MQQATGIRGRGNPTSMYKTSCTWLFAATKRTASNCSQKLESDQTAVRNWKVIKLQLENGKWSNDIICHDTDGCLTPCMFSQPSAKTKKCTTRNKQAGQLQDGATASTPIQNAPTFWTPCFLQQPLWLGHWQHSSQLQTFHAQALSSALISHVPSLISTL